jgi:hypothetical protein
MINQEKMIDHKSLMNKLEVMINQKEAIKRHFNSNMDVTRKIESSLEWESIIQEFMRVSMEKKFSLY